MGSLGRLAFQKNPQMLYRAVAPVLKKRPEMILFHIGRGELDEELKALARELGIEGQLIRREYLTNPAGFYQSLEAYLLPSRYEGLPISVLEALATDTPVILTDVPGSAEFGTLGLSHCWMSPTEDAGRFAEAIEAWLADLPRERERNHRKIAVERYSPEKGYGAMLDAYRGD